MSNRPNRRRRPRRDDVNISIPDLHRLLDHITDPATDPDDARLGAVLVLQLHPDLRDLLGVEPGQATDHDTLLATLHRLRAHLSEHGLSFANLRRRR